MLGGVLAAGMHSWQNQVRADVPGTPGQSNCPTSWRELNGVMWDHKSVEYNPHSQKFPSPLGLVLQLNATFSCARCSVAGCALRCVCWSLPGEPSAPPSHPSLHTPHDAPRKDHPHRLPTVGMRGIYRASPLQPVPPAPTPQIAFCGDARNAHCAGRPRLGAAIRH